jgi:hypothetical protein
MSAAAGIVDNEASGIRCDSMQHAKLREMQKTAWSVKYRRKEDVSGSLYIVA